MVDSESASPMEMWVRRLEAAREGSLETLGELLEQLRSFLTLIAQSELDSELRGKESVSDLIQRTLMEAAGDFGRFRGQSEPEFRAWLKNILVNNIRDAVARYLAQKRQVSREVTLSEGLENLVDQTEETPSQVAQHSENLARLGRAMKQLSADQQEIIRLRHQENRSFEEIATRLGVSVAAAQKRWARAIDELREIMKLPLSES